MDLIKSSIGILALLLIGCTGQLDSINKHEAANPHNSTFETPQKNIENYSFYDLRNWQDQRVVLNADFSKAVEAELNREIYDKNFLSKSEALVLQLCPLEKVNCNLIMHFKRFPNSPRLFESLAKNSETLDKYYHFLYLSFETQNQMSRNESIELFLEKASIYKSELDKKTEKSHEQQKFAITLKYLLDLFHQGKLSLKNIEWLKSLNLLESNNGTDLVISAQHLMKNNSAEFAEHLKKTQSKPQSYTNLLRNLMNKNRALLENYKVAPLNIDSYLYITEQVYFSEISPRVAAEMIFSANLDSKKINETILSYVEFQILHLILLAQDDIKLFLQQAKDIQPEKYFIEINNYLSTSTKNAKSLNDRTQSLVQLLSYVKSPKTSTTTLSSLQKNIKTLVTYPQTIILLYSMARNGVLPEKVVNLPVRIHLASATFGDLLKLLFNGMLPPLLNYHQDETTHNKFEIIESFESLVKSNYFTILDIEADLFLSTFWDSIFLYGIENERVNRSKFLKDRKDNLEAKYASGEWKDVLNLCKAINAGDQQNLPYRTIPFSEVIHSPTLGRLASRLNDSYEGTNQHTVNGITIVNKGYYAPANNLNIQLEKIRLDINNYIKIFKTLKSFFKTDTLFSKLDSRVEKVKSEVKSFVLLYNLRLKEFENCYFPILQREKHIMAKIFQYESIFWKDISTEKSKYHFPFKYSLPSGINWKTKYSNNQILTHNSDFLLRVKNYLQFGYRQLPAIDEKLNIELTENYVTHPIFTESTSRSIPIGSSADEFSKIALNSSSYTATVNWYNSSYINLTGIDNYYDALAQFYRMQGDLTEIYEIPTLRTTYDLLVAPLRVYKLIHLSNDEKENLQWIGRSSRYDYSYLGLLESLDEATPSHRPIIEKVTAKWMAHYSRRDVWENPENKMKRPVDLQPLIDLAEKFASYRKNKSESIFIKTFSSDDSLQNEIKKAIKADFKLAHSLKEDFLTHAKNRESMFISFDVQRTLEVPLFGKDSLQSFETQLIDFKNKTGNFYKLDSN